MLSRFDGLAEAQESSGVAVEQFNFVYGREMALLNELADAMFSERKWII